MAEKDIVSLLSAKKDTESCGIVMQRGSFDKTGRVH